MAKKPTGFVATCQCGAIVGALDYARTDLGKAGQLIGKWLHDGCTVSPRFAGTWDATVEACRCKAEDGAPALEERTGVGQWCAPGPASEQTRKWLLMFDDRDRGLNVYEDEAEARRAFAMAEGRGWNCHLFAHAPRGLTTNIDAPPTVILGADLTEDKAMAPIPQMIVGGKYNWKNQPERLVYMGRKRYPGDGRFWHQFEKIGAPGIVWCEVLDSDLHMLEETLA